MIPQVANDVNCGVRMPARASGVQLLKSDREVLS